MNEKLKKLLDSINARKQKVKDLVAAGKLDDAKTEKTQLIKEQQEFDLLYDLDDDAPPAGTAGDGAPAGMKAAGTGDPAGDPGPAPTVKQVGAALVQADRKSVV